MMIKIVNISFAAILGICLFASPSSAQDDSQPSVADRIEKATRKLNQKQTYKLAYKLKPGETVRWTVEHVASTKTQMAGELEETSSRSESTKAWKVNSVDTRGNITFVHSIESVNMWQKIGDSEPVSYNSLTDKDIPNEYQSVADKLDRPLAVFSINPNGEVTDKKSSLKNARFGAGDVTVPLPNEAIPVGHRWNIPTDLSATDEDGHNHNLKARISYEMVKVKDGNAYISFRTEVLTPVESEKIKSQIMQQMTKGYLVFDIANGRPIRKEVEWDEKVQGYEGPDSYLQYLGRMTERLIDPNTPSSVKTSPLNSSPLKPLGEQSSVAKQQIKIKTRDGNPIMRK